MVFTSPKFLFAVNPETVVDEPFSANDALIGPPKNNLFHGATTP